MPPRILLCDDEIHILRAAEFKFQRAGFDVATAGDGEAAWQAIQQCRPDIVVSDYQMPRLDGFGLVRRLRESPATADLPVILLTAKGFELSHEELCQRWNVAAVLAKPFSPRELLARVEMVLAARAGSPPGGESPASEDSTSVNALASAEGSASIPASAEGSPLFPVSPPVHVALPSAGAPLAQGVPLAHGSPAPLPAAGVEVQRG